MQDLASVSPRPLLSGTTLIDLSGREGKNEREQGGMQEFLTATSKCARV